MTILVGSSATGTEIAPNSVEYKSSSLMVAFPLTMPRGPRQTNLCARMPHVSESRRTLCMRLFNNVADVNGRTVRRETESGKPGTKLFGEQGTHHWPL